MTSTPRLLDMLEEASRSVSRDVDLRDRLIAQLYRRDIPLRRLGQITGLSHETVRTIAGAAATRSKPIRVD